MTYPENIEEIKKFAKKIDLDVKYLLGEKCDGGSYLGFYESLPDNIQFNVGDYLDLRSVKSLPTNIVFNVGGSLYLHSVKSLPDNIQFNVGGWLYLPSVKSLPSSTIFNVGKEIHLPTKHKVNVIWS